MKLSKMCHTGYDGPYRPGLWPSPPAGCNREVARRSIADAIKNASLAEEVGFDWVSVSEHHYSPITLTPNPIVMAAAISQVTNKVKIAVLGPLLPINNPIRVAEELAMLDSMSNGRTVVLFLRGTPNEALTYEAVDEAVARSRTQEGIDLIIKAWQEPEPFAWHGPNYNFETISVWPRILQEPTPPVFGSGNSDQSVIFAAQRRISIAISFAPLPAVRHWVELYHTEAEKNGWSPTPDDVIYRHLIHIDETDERAAQSMAEAGAALARDAAQTSGVLTQEMGGPREQMSTPVGFQPFFFGGPDTIIEKARQLREIGVGILDLAFIVPGTQNQAKAIRCFGELCRNQIKAM